MNEISDIRKYVKDTLSKRTNSGVLIPSIASGMIAWTRVISGVDDGLVIKSTPQMEGNQFDILYGASNHSGTVGFTLSGSPIISGDMNDVGYRPAPGVSAIDVDERAGEGGLSRSCTISLKCYTLGQLDILKKYFLEPGNVVFLEWGILSTMADGVSDTSIEYYSKLPLIEKPSIDDLSKYYEFKNIADSREKSAGHYDCYLGFISGGDITVNTDGSYNMNIKLIGLNELPTALKTYTINIDKSKSARVTFDATTISSTASPSVKRFMRMFNELPSSMQSDRRFQLYKDEYITNAINYINFEDAITSGINNAVTGWFNKEPGFTIPDGVNFITDQKYIRFGTLIDIINQNGLGNNVTVNGNIVNFKIDTSRAIATGFDRMFSVDGTKLFVPNVNTPSVKLADLITTGESSAIKAEQYSEKVDSSIKYGIYKAEFPSSVPIEKGKTKKNTRTGDVDYMLFDSEGNTNKQLNVDARKWGFVDDLYINFKFACDILNTENLNLKDCLLSMLNGMSSAVCGLWDFQILEDEETNTLRVYERNVFIRYDKQALYNFSVYGQSSIFKDFSFTMSFAKEFVNQIVASKLMVSANTNDVSLKGKTFGRNTNDKLLDKIKILREVEATRDSKGLVPPTPATANADEATSIKEDNRKILLNTFTLVPKIELTNNVGYTRTTTQTNGPITGYGSRVAGSAIYTPTSTAGFKSYDDISLNDSYSNFTIQVALNDKLFFKSLKDEYDTSIGADFLSPIIPVDIEFTLMGISGLRRWDTFTTTGLPTGYDSEYGVWQIISIQHNINNNMWYTKITAKFRQLKFTDTKK
jgi:hypothetical protein